MSRLAALIERLETYYDFECAGGPLKNCVEWQQLKAALSAGEPALLSDEQIGLKLGIQTGCCHFNDNGWCIDHSGGRHTSNYCTEAHIKASDRPGQTP
jgi:hypothetical protein